ncbi:hypothetical protein L9F63_012185, partial [Diploptera punctata]
YYAPTSSSPADDLEAFHTLVRHLQLIMNQESAWGSYSTPEHLVDSFEDLQNSESLKGHICPQCGKSYRWKSTLDRHLRLECGKEPQFQCPYCAYRAKRKSNLEKHIVLRHHVNTLSVNLEDAGNGLGLYPCPSCFKIYQWKKSLLLHIRYECGKEAQFHCPYCPHKAKLKGNLSKHIRRMHFVDEQNIGLCLAKPYSCTYGSNTFKTTDCTLSASTVEKEAPDKERHMVLQLGIGSNASHSAPSSLWSRHQSSSSFLILRKEINGQQSSPGAMDIIRSSFPVIQNPAYASKNEEHKCTNCGKIYRWKKSLNLHLRVECGKEPQFQCPLCPYKAKQKGNLKSHVRVCHSDDVIDLAGEVELQCANKSRQFSNIAQHSSSQQNERRFQIIGEESNDNEKKSIFVENLLTQVPWQQQNTNNSYIGSFKCPTCGKTYRWKHSMVSHYRYECGKEPQFSCPLCPYKCKQKGNLKSHVRIPFEFFGTSSENY